jgi:hypothetical protein
MDPRLPEPPGSPRLLRARGVGEILVDAFTLYRLHWRNLLAIVAVVVVPLTIVQVLVTNVLIEENVIERRIADGTDAGVEVTVTDIRGGDIAAVLLGAVIVLVVSALTWSILTGAIYVWTRRIGTDSRDSGRSSSSESWPCSRSSVVSCC